MMYKKNIIIFTSILIYFIFLINVNLKYPENVVNDIVDMGKGVCIDGVKLSIDNFSTVDSDSYYNRYKDKGVCKNNDALCYLVMNLNITNESDESKIFDLTQLRLVQNIWCDYFCLSDLYAINDISSYVLQILPHHTGTLIVPFLYMGSEHEVFTEVIDKGFTLYIRQNNVKWNEIYRCNLSDFVI